MAREKRSKIQREQECSRSKIDLLYWNGTRISGIKTSNFGAWFVWNQVANAFQMFPSEAGVFTFYFIQIQSRTEPAIPYIPILQHLWNQDVALCYIHRRCASRTQSSERTSQRVNTIPGEWKHQPATPYLFSFSTYTRNHWGSRDIVVDGKNLS